jgi:hypothetical protein
VFLRARIYIYICVCVCEIMQSIESDRANRESLPLENEIASRPRSKGKKERENERHAATNSLTNLTVLVAEDPELVLEVAADTRVRAVELGQAWV